MSPQDQDQGYRHEGQDRRAEILEKKYNEAITVGLTVEDFEADLDKRGFEDRTIRSYIKSFCRGYKMTVIDGKFVSRDSAKSLTDLERIKEETKIFAEARDILKTEITKYVEWGSTRPEGQYTDAHIITVLKTHKKELLELGRVSEEELKNMIQSIKANMQIERI